MISTIMLSRFRVGFCGRSPLVRSDVLPFPPFFLRAISTVYIGSTLVATPSTLWWSVNGLLFFLEHDCKHCPFSLDLYLLGINGCPEICFSGFVGQIFFVYTGLEICFFVFFNTLFEFSLIKQKRKCIHFFS